MALCPLGSPFQTLPFPGAHLGTPLSSPLKVVEVGGRGCPPSLFTAVSPTEMYQFSIQESAPIGTAVGRVKAEDSDVGENTDMTYHLKEESGSGGQVFKVTTDSDTQEAIIVVQKVRLPQEVWRGGGGRCGVQTQVGWVREALELPHSPDLSGEPGPTWGKQ